MKWNYLHQNDAHPKTTAGARSVREWRGQRLRRVTLLISPTPGQSMLRTGMRPMRGFVTCRAGLGPDTGVPTESNRNAWCLFTLGGRDASFEAE